MKENINIYGLVEKIGSKDNIDFYSIEDFILANRIADTKLVEVITGEYNNQYLSTIDNPENKRNICVYEPFYLEPEDNTFSLNQLLKDLKYNYIGAYIVCEKEDGYLDKMFFVTADNHEEYEKLRQLEQEYHKQKENIAESSNINLKEISQKIKKAVINQDEVVDKVLSNIVFNQKLYYSNFPIEEARLLKKNILIFGKTGTGKTEVIRQVLNNLDYNIPCIIEDANGYTIEGYKGKSVTDILRHLVVEANYNIEEAQHGIIIIDEIDKKLPNGDESEIASTGVLKSLLKIIEGGKFDLTDNQNSKFNGKIIDTSLITIILLGHFEKLYDKKEKNAIGFNSINEKEREKYTPEDFVKIGMIPEFMGRVGIITKTNDMDIETIKKIITDSNISPIMLEKKFYKALGTNITFDKESLTIMAQKALEKGTGARGIKSSYEEMIGNLSFDLLSGDIKEVSFEKGRARKRRYQTNEMERTI